MPTVCHPRGRRLRCRPERLQFQQALASRGVIGQAKGILMAQSHITADEAFDMLRRASQRLNRKVVSIAQDIVNNKQQQQ